MQKKIAITGGIGSGKSLAATCLQELGYPVFSCDEIYKEVIQSPAYLQKVGRFFPSCLQNGAVDRKKLASLVFQSEEKRALLNKISHPLIMAELQRKMQECTSALVFAEVPLLFEGNFETQFDYVFVILRNKGERIAALQKRDGLTKLEAEQRIAAQFDYDSERAKSKYEICNAALIPNVGSKETLKSHLKEELTKIMT